MLTLILPFRRPRPPVAPPIARPAPFDAAHIPSLGYLPRRGKPPQALLRRLADPKIPNLWPLHPKEWT